MNFEIVSKLSLCDIFGGTFKNAQTDVQLNLNGDYSLIQANLQSNTPQPFLDVFSVLNEAFGLSLPTGFLMVDEAGFFTYSYRGDASSPVSLSSAFPNSGLSPILTMNAQPETDTAAFWFTLTIGSNVLFNTLIELNAEDKETSKLTFQAILESGAAPDDAMTAAHYYVSLPTFTLLKLFTFSDVTLYFQFSETSKTYQIQGNLSVHVFDKDYDFFGRVTSSEIGINGCVSLASDSSNTSIDDPFGGMPGINIDGLVFAMQHTYKTETVAASSVFRVQGMVKFGEDISVTGQLYLEGSTPIMASVLIGGSLDIGNIFSQCLPGFSWPSSFINIVFEDNSRLYYLKDTAPVGLTDSTIVCSIDPQDPTPVNDPMDMAYQTGFNAFSYFTLTLLVDIPLAGNINITPNQGISASIQLRNAIELWVLKITAKSGSDALSNENALQGPTFFFNSANNVKTMGFDCSLLFFQTDFGVDVSVNASKGISNNELLVKGTLANTASISPFLPANTSMAFSYSQSQGFRVDDWPEFLLDDVEKYIDFFTELKTIANSSSDVCGKLVGFINKEALTSKFKMTPTFDTVASQSGGKKDTLCFVVKGELQLFCVGTLFGSIPSPVTFRIKLNDTFTFSSLLSALWDEIKDVAQQLVTAVINDPEAISSFLAFFAAQQAVSYAASLACKGLAEGTVVAATEAGSTAFSAAGGIAAGAGAVASGIAGVAGSIGSSCFTAGTKVRLANGKDVDIQEVVIGDVLLGEEASHNRVVSFDRPILGSRLLYSLNDSIPFVTSEHPFLTSTGWKAIDPIATRRENATLQVGTLQVGDEIKLADGGFILLDKIQSNGLVPANTQLYNFHLSPGHSYVANGYVVHNKGGGSGGDNPPSAPTHLELVYDTNQLTVTWQPASGAESYSIALTPPSPDAKQSKSVAYNVYQCTFDISNTSPAGIHSVIVTANNSHGHTAAPAVTILKLSIPVLTILLKTDSPQTIGHVDPALLANPVLTLSWPSVADAQTYTLNMNDQVHTWDAVESGVQSEQITFTDKQPSGVYDFSLMASGEGKIPSDTSAMQSWTRFVTPTNLTYTSEASQQDILLSWTGNYQGSDYVVEILDKDNVSIYTARISASANDSDAPQTATIPLSDLPQNVSVSAHVRAVPTLVNDQNIIPSIWSTLVSFSTTQTPEQIAAACYANGDSATICAQLLMQNFSDLSPSHMAQSMKYGGYTADHVAVGLVAVYADSLKSTDLAAALVSAYGILPTAAAIAQTALAEGKSGVDSASLILLTYPDLDVTRLLQAMAAGGYGPSNAAQAALNQSAELSASDLSALLIKTFKRQE